MREIAANQHGTGGGPRGRRQRELSFHSPETGQPEETDGQETRGQNGREYVPRVIP